MPLHDQFADGIFSGDVPHAVIGRNADEAARRYSVYRNNVLHSLTEALSQRFPVVKRIVGHEFFNSMARVFIEKHPPRSPILHTWGNEFASFLKAFPPARSVPYLPDIARLEYARGEAYHAADAHPLDAEQLQVYIAEPDRFSIPMHPSLRLLSSKFSVGAIWEANQDGNDPTPNMATRLPESVLVLRDPSFDVQTWRLTEADALFVAELLKSGKLVPAAGRACVKEPNYNPTPLLVRLVSAGAFAESLEETNE